jgi:hydroxymethylglutaryl-CoA lyase
MDLVKIIECPRDAWQGLKLQIPTERKVAYLRALIDAGFRHLDAVSFVSPKAVPQMADSEQVLAQLASLKPDGLKPSSSPNEPMEIIGIVVNEKGAERAIATKAVMTLGYPCSISETFLRRNQNQSLDENHEVMKRIKEMADAASLSMVVYISMAFGNPYGDRWSEEDLSRAAQEIGAAGIDSISLADTVGAADETLIHRVVTAVLNDCDKVEIGVHMHSTRAATVPKVLAAYDAGCRRFDSALGGMGGCPFAQDKLVGNIATEEVLRALGERGVNVPIDLSKVMPLNSAIGVDFRSE